MKNAEKTTGKKVSLETRNDAKAKFEAWLKETERKQAELDAKIAEQRKQKRTASTNFQLSDNVLLEILNAGPKGITIGELMKLSPKQYYKKNKATGEMEKQTSYSIDTLARDWNKANCLIQYRQEKFMEKGLFVPFKVTSEPPASNLSCKGNNRIAIDNYDTFAPVVIDYLKKQSNFNEDWLK